MRDNCPLCRGTKDKRAVYCLPCRRVVTPSIRRGTGLDRRLNANGYITVQVDDKAVYEHRHKIEKKIGRKLTRGEHVHHINGVKTDNRLTNLRLMDGREHHREHMLEGGFAKRMSKLGHATRWGV